MFKLRNGVNDNYQYVNDIQKRDETLPMEGLPGRRWLLPLKLTPGQMYQFIVAVDDNYQYVDDSYQYVDDTHERNETLPKKGRPGRYWLPPMKLAPGQMYPFMDGVDDNHQYVDVDFDV